MSITKISSGIPLTEQIRQLNTQTFELNGRIAGVDFVQNQITHLHQSTGISTKYLVDQEPLLTESIFDTLTHFDAKAGYSIWKLTPNNYTYNVANQLFFDLKLATNKGLALSDVNLAFDSVLLYNGDSYVDYTTQAADDSSTNKVYLPSSTDQYLYVGLDTKFNGINFNLFDRAVGYSLQLEYWNGSAWDILEPVFNALVDNTSHWSNSGVIQWDEISNWGTTTVISEDAFYYIRIKTLTAVSQYFLPTAIDVLPANSVESLLTLSSTQVINEEWAWCSYGSDVYVTIKNGGNSAYEGVTFITPTSSSENIYNYFVYNHYISMNYVDSTFSTGAIDASLIPFSLSGMTATNIRDAIIEIFNAL